MKGLKGFLPVLLLGLISVSCSDVKFSPGPPLQSKDRTQNSQSLSETFFFNPSNTERKVDVLFVVDNSGSMAEEQLKMGERLSSFTDLLTGVDWQLGVTTTDVSNGPYGIKGQLLPFSGTGSYILTRHDPNYETAFLNTVVRDETGHCTSGCPSSLEQPLLATLLAMAKSQTANRGFFRPDADLAVVILTDEDEMSSGPINATRGSEVLLGFQQYWGTHKKLTAYGIIVQPGDTDCQRQQGGGAERAGDLIAEFVTLTGGVLGSICDTDYSKNLERIGERVRETLQSIELKETPDPETLKVKFTPKANSSTYRVVGKKLLFDVPPPEGTRIDVSYKVFRENEEHPGQGRDQNENRPEEGDENSDTNGSE